MRSRSWCVSRSWSFIRWSSRGIVSRSRSVIRRSRGFVRRSIIRRSGLFIRDSWGSVRVDWGLIWDTVVVLRGNIGGIISKFISAARSEKKVCQDGS